MNRYLHLFFSDDDIMVSYVNDNETMLCYKYPYGHKFLESLSLGKQARSTLEAVVLSMFEQISLYDRIPSDVRVDARRNKEWIRRIIEGLSYAQFYLGASSVHVTLSDSTLLPVHARYQETLQSFKV